jgi:hypothetical protein
MNKITNNIQNKIKQPSQCCIHCGKSYVKRENLNKHAILCDLLHKARNTKLIIDDEDDEQVPSPKKMYQMLIELGLKYSKIEEKIEEINKWVVKKKKKINVLDWLNSNITPTVKFDDIIDNIIVNEEDVNFLLHNTFYDVLNKIFERTIYNFNENENPMFAFVQKINMFYIYDSNNIWIELNREKLTKFLNKIHMKVFKAFYEWKKEKGNEIKSNDNTATLCDKTLIKIMNIEFTQESILSKVKSNMYSRMKTDMKALVEYEFEF